MRSAPSLFENGAAVAGVGGPQLWVDVMFRGGPVSGPLAGRSHRVHDEPWKPMATARILIVDDDVDLQRVVTRVAKDAGLEVVQALDGAQGLVLATKERFDLILLDVHLPKLDGRDVLSILKKSPDTASVPVLVYSGGADQNDRLVALELGADDYIDKPLEAEHLVAKITRLIENVDKGSG